MMLMTEHFTCALFFRDEAQTKMILLKEKSDRDIQQHNAEMKELVRVIDHDKKLREFMACKGKERDEDPQMVEWRRKKGDCSIFLTLFVHTLVSVGFVTQFEVRLPQIFCFKLYKFQDHCYQQY